MCTEAEGKKIIFKVIKKILDQALQYQGKAVSIGSCAACHPNSKGEGTNEYGEVHGGSNPETYNACFICHTSVNTDTTKWPYGFQWKQRP